MLLSWKEKLFTTTRGQTRLKVRLVWRALHERRCKRHRLSARYKENWANNVFHIQRIMPDKAQQFPHGDETAGRPAVEKDVRTYGEASRGKTDTTKLVFFICPTRGDDPTRHLSPPCIFIQIPNTLLCVHARVLQPDEVTCLKLSTLIAESLNRRHSSRNLTQRISRVSRRPLTLEFLHSRRLILGEA